MIEGSFYIDKIIYKDLNSNFLIMATTMDGLSYTLLGECNAIEGETIDAKVMEVNHPKYGLQYSIVSYSKKDNLDNDYISNYLLEQIYDTYDDKEKFDLDKMKEIVLKLLSYNFDNNLIIKICSKYKNQTLKKITKNPYNILSDFIDVNFKFVDDIAFKIGFDENCIERMSALILYYLNYSENSKGNVFEYYDNLYYYLGEYLGYEIKNYDEILSILQINKKIFIYDTNDNKKVYLYDNYIIEKNLSLMLLERKNNINIITGGPGTGKTTMLKSIANEGIDNGLKVLLLAPTGRAAKRMFEATQIDAKTIHRALEFVSDNHKYYFNKNEKNPLNVDILIVDEMSMVDFKLFYNLILATPFDTKIYLVGDKNQLPSVSSGQVLSDLIKSNLFNKTVLTKIHRQAESSQIIINAHKILNNEKVDLDNSCLDFSFQKMYTPNDIIDYIIKLLDYYILEKNIDSNDIQVICATKKNEIGTLNLNKILQNKLNPKSSNKTEINLYNQTFRINDKVMQNKNNYDLFWEIKNDKGLVIEDGYGIFNGDMGIILDINKESLEFTIDFDGRICTYNYEDIKDLILSYAITVHKSQGSEYPIIIFPIFTASYFLLNKNLLYTGITRAKSICSLVGDEKIFYRMEANEIHNKRNSSLCSKTYFSE